MKRLWTSLYDKVRGQMKGLLAGGAAATAVTSVTNVADLTDLTPSQRTAWTLGVAALLGALNAYRTPETRTALPAHRRVGNEASLDPPDPS